jgi:hypothetical protein
MKTALTIFACFSLLAGCGAAPIDSTVQAEEPACLQSEYYDVTGACGAPDLPGTCKPVPEFCFEIYKPVCGCDGRSYSNDCVRLHAQVQLDHAGPCDGNNP